MMDATVSLAFSVYSNKGVYALLLGSGISRPSGIPTGWEVAIDLVRRVAAVEGVDCGPDPAAWFRTKFRAEPDYSKLLDQIAKTQTERQQVLRSYFEPTEAERAEGSKSPTAAHKAIAQLVAAGYLRLIITTNFDRLTERALEEVSVTPTVISSADQILGALPLAHSGVTIIKLHGDYLDARIKNTEDELAAYDPALSKLLDQVLDEYGLIISGWSADWDPGLRAAIQRCSSRRFTTYWTTRSALSDKAMALSGHRRAQVIHVLDANQFFNGLLEKVQALADCAAPHPLSAKIAVATVKRLMVDEASRIRLHDLVHVETERLFSELNDSNFPLKTQLSAPELSLRIKRYELLSDVLLSIVTTGCRWGDVKHAPLWTGAISRIGNAFGDRNGAFTHLIELHRYPALLLVYGAGLSATIGEQYATLWKIITVPRSLDQSSPEPLISELPMESVRFGKNLSAHVYDLFRARFTDLLPIEEEFQTSFDLFEYLLGLTTLHVSNGMRWRVGQFAFRYRYRPESTVEKRLDAELLTQGTNHPLIAAGFFDGSVREFMDRKKQFDQRIAGMLRH